ncbi:MAG TPA: LacI family DNA-binding transcriptional regulator, partial [Candidatus Ventrisoma faecale]|nr:LacI family DNA-binding transcriptional regulator [Candidatus Ventrisoma faecale]
MATIKDVAKMAGVSVCTVSRAIAGKGYIGQETYDRVMKAVEELQYTPNKTAVGLKTGRTNIIALVVPGIRNVYYPKLATCVQNYADEKGYMMLLCSTDYSLEKEKKIIEKLCSQKVSGVMITTCSNENAHIKKLKSYNIP